MKSKQDQNLRGFRRTRYLEEEERCRLLYGPYKPPLVRDGFLVDAVRGKVRFSHFTNAPIPWPKCKKPKSRSGGGSGGHVLCGDLVRALTDESASAIAYHWGVCHGTIIKWRLALGLKGRSAGSWRLMNIGVELARLPESQAKRSGAMRGKVLSKKHKIRLHAGMKEGWKERFAARREAYRRTGRFPKATKSDPWIPEEEKLLAKYSTTDLARILKRTPKSIQARRISLGIRLRPPVVQRRWNESEVKLLGADTDRIIAKRLRRSVMSVSRKRNALGIKGCSRKPRAGKADR